MLHLLRKKARKQITQLGIVLLLLSNISNAQDTDKKENDSKEKKKKVTRIVIYKDEDGKTIKEDSTIVNGEFFDWDNFSKNFDIVST